MDVIDVAAGAIGEGQGLALGQVHAPRRVLQDIPDVDRAVGVYVVARLVARLKQEGLLEETISPDFLVRNWSPALAEWSTKAVRDTFYASPQFPRLLDSTVLRDTLAEGVSRGKFGYVGKTATGEYEGLPTIDQPSFGPGNVEFSDQVVLLPRDTAIALRQREQGVQEGAVRDERGEYGAGEPSGAGAAGAESAAGAAGVDVSERPGGLDRLRWEGAVPPQKWMNFYMRVLTRFATDPNLRIRVQFETEPDGGITQQQLEETKISLRELGLDDTCETEPQEPDQAYPSEDLVL